MKDISPLLTPIIAFDCYCGKHEDGSKLCLDPHTWSGSLLYLHTKNISEPPPRMLVCKSKVYIPNFKVVCFFHALTYCFCVQEVSLGDDVTLLALPFAEDLEPSLSFKWRKRSPRLSGRENELEFKASSN